MVDSVGKKLQQARLRGQISIDDAARSTRMRPGAIADLENDNYTNFPNTAYAKGFLVIYAKYLGVDVSEFADTMENANPVAIEEYEYLNASKHARTVAHRAPARSMAPLAFLAVMLVSAVVVMYLIVSFQRLGGGQNLEQIAENKGTVPIVTPSASVAPSPAIIVASANPGAAASPAASATAQPSASPLADASASPAPMAAVSPSAPPLPAIVTLTPLVKEIVLKPLKKTRVTIRKDVADSRPVFEDFLYPNANPLKLRGTRFWIKMEDPTAIQITRDGQPVPSDQPNITIE